uniref:Activator of basal transcription 1 n=1 Tax=Rhabditophanes sp. KR3021 TaxID=114890 RepID=A0AC35U074_9BILA
MHHHYSELPIVNVKRDIRDICIQKDKILTLKDIEALDNDEDDESMEVVNEDAVAQEKGSGMVYLQTIPPFYNVAKIREVLSRFGEIGKIHLTVDPNKKGRNLKQKHYVEGWVEFKKKKEGKMAVNQLNCTLVGGKRRHAAADSMWAMKYLSGFKWYHLQEQLNFEKNVEKKRFGMEMSQARKQASHFADQVDKGRSLAKLEEKVLKKGGLWEVYQKQITQRKSVSKKKKVQEMGKDESEDFMGMFFDSKHT